MGKKIVSILVLMLCLGLTMAGCAKKTVVKEEPSTKKEEALAKPEAERTKEMKGKEEQGAKEFEKGLVAKKEPVIEGRSLKANFLKTSTSTLISTISVQGTQRF